MKRFTLTTALIVVAFNCYAVSKFPWWLVTPTASPTIGTPAPSTSDTPRPNDISPTPTATSAASSTPESTATANPTSTPTGTAAPSITPEPTTTAKPTSTPSRNIRGVYELVAGGDQVTGNEPGWTKNPVGLRFRGDWRTAQPNAGTADFSLLDKFITAAKAHPDKLTGVSYMAGPAYPTWLEGAGGKIVTLNGNKIALPWDSVVVAKWADFIHQFIAHCTEKGFKPDYVVIGNLGDGLTTGMAVTPDDIALLDGLGGLKSWGDNARAMVDMYAPLGTNMLVAAAAAPYSNSDGSGALQSFVDDSAAKYPLFGPMHTALRYPVGNAGQPYKLLLQYKTTSHPTGLQFVNSVNHPLTNPPPVCKTPSDTCFADALGMAIDPYYVKIVEIYSADDTDENQDAIKDANNRLR